MELKWKKHVFNFNPTAAQLIVVGPTTFHVMGVKRGTWVRDVAVRVGVAFNGTGAAVNIGDGTGNIFATSAQVIPAATGLKHGYGTAFSGSNGKLYTGDDTVDLFYTGHAVDATTGACSVIVTYAELE